MSSDKMGAQKSGQSALGKVDAKAAANNAKGGGSSAKNTDSAAKKEARYVVEGAEVFCNLGDSTTTMVASGNSRIGSELAILDTDTTPDSFEEDFGHCKALNARCDLALLPKWFNTNTQYLGEGGWILKRMFHGINQKSAQSSHS